MGTRITFKEVSEYASKRVKCVGCSKKVSRKKRFFQTVNPFNTDSDGTQKDERAIRLELCREANIWMIQPERCNNCKSILLQLNKG